MVGSLGKVSWVTGPTFFADALQFSFSITASQQPKALLEVAASKSYVSRGPAVHVFIGQRQLP